MAADPNLRSVMFACGHCQWTFEQPMAWLQKNFVFRCPHCDVVITTDSPAGDATTTPQPAAGLRRWYRGSHS
jgi:hypothetical protein